MSDVKSTIMTEQEENELEKFAKAHVKVVAERPFTIADADPFLVRKLQAAYKCLEEAPLPDWLLKRQMED